MSTTATTAAPQAVLRSDYRPSAYLIDTVDLDFDLGEEFATVKAKVALRRNPRGDDSTLRLDGEGLETLAIRMDGRELGDGDYSIQGDVLSIADCPEQFVLETEVRIKPQENLELSGLYKSSGNFCTQCEAQGFRRITWFLDRPDVMARYSTTITANNERYPVLLSNGNRVSSEDLGDGRQRVRWEDPFPKPSYLFALVAGNLACHAGKFTTCSGREIDLEVWVEPAEIDKCEHALRALQKSMKWDEDAYGLEYDLDLYMIVAVGDFNMGAMENKGLNVFNSKYVLARPETATDDDFEHVEAVIAHEYCHNWTGNRVTCRDWFQLTLKEGLTVFRDQQFTADTTSAGVKRIADVRALWTRQFPEDAGPLSHPIRPESYIAMDNFYTSTVYEKGAEVIRMYHTLLGAEGFRKGMDLYFERHDGQAVTCDDFRAAMADANGRDFDQFERWYSQAGTPRLHLETLRRGDELALTFTQKAPRGQDAFRPMHIPVRCALLDSEGQEVAVSSAGDREAVIELTGETQTVHFSNVPEGAVPSVLRGYSAPVELEFERDDATLAFLYRCDTDEFNRWDAGQRLFGTRILGMAEELASGGAPTLSSEHVEAFRGVLTDASLDGSIRAFLLTLPSEIALAQRMETIDPDGLHAARKLVRRELAQALHGELLELYNTTKPAGRYRHDAGEVQRRALNSVALAYLCAGETPEAIELAWQHFESADNMTDYEAAFACLVQSDSPRRAQALEHFHAKWKADPLVLDKWFVMQAACSLPGAAERVRELAEHPDFDLKNPNRARSVVNVFAAGNPTGFHDASGDGYRWVGDKVLEIGAFNPQVAARLAKSFNQWRRYDTNRQAAMRAVLEGLRDAEGVSKDVFEVASTALG